MVLRCLLQVLLQQQEEAVHRAGVFEAIKSLADGSLRRLTGSRIGNRREEAIEQSNASTASLAAERESLIAEFRDNLYNLINAFRWAAQTSV